jgi:hypothetical protein
MTSELYAEVVEKTSHVIDAAEIKRVSRLVVYALRRPDVLRWRNLTMFNTSLREF